ncbi:MAG TPA: type III pantothenate kinase [Nevskiales bacterium]|nr:type III pantothenate kinase [Nevskiales bacterium]
MKLLFDIGNTRLKWAWWDQTLQSGGARVHAGHSPQAVLEALELERKPAELWVASVAAPALHAAIEGWAQTRWGLVPHWVSSGAAACGVRNAYAQPARLGVDRWLAMIAAYRRARGAVFVVDAGTALTIDVVGAGGQHCGGLIAPGLATQRQSLRQVTQVRAGDPAQAPGWLGIDTDTAVSWGTLHGVLGLIDRVLAGIRREHAAITPFITGGDAAALQPLLAGEWLLAPDLVLEGLACVASESKGSWGPHDSRGRPP